jgi:ABC-type polysaccharide/polyol phosphate export permease
MRLVTERRAAHPGLLGYRSLIWNFAQRDLKSRFKGTAIGWGWSLILPLATLLVYTLVAHYIFRAQPPDFGSGRAGNFAVWLFVGLTAWGFFANGINAAIAGLLGTGPLLTKIYFPSYAPVLGTVVAVMIQSGIEVGLVLVLLAVFGNAGLTWALVPIWAAIFTVFVTGLSLVFAIANIYFRDLQHLVAVALQLMFFATPILYPDTLISDPTLHTVIVSNPMSQFVDLFRANVYGLEVGSWTAWLYVIVWAAAALAAGVAVFNRWGRDLGEQL